jgi:hypothetical protein
LSKLIVDGYNPLLRAYDMARTATEQIFGVGESNASRDENPHTF